MHSEKRREWLNKVFSRHGEIGKIMNEELLLEIVKQLQKKYQHITEISNQTKEMADSISRNDRVSAQMLLAMRQEEMNQSDKCDKNIACLLDALSESQADQIREWMSGKNIVENKGFETKKICEISRHIRLSLEKTIAIDKGMSSRLAGKDSFYK